MRKRIGTAAAVALLAVAPGAWWFERRRIGEAAESARSGTRAHRTPASGGEGYSVRTIGAAGPAIWVTTRCLGRVA
jgi:hypothetical protein